MPMIDSLLAEFESEAKTTRRVLARVPDDRLAYRPHERSMTLGRLAGHVAEIPSWAAPTLHQEVLDFAAGSYESFTAESGEQLMARFERGLDDFRQAAAGYPDDKLFVTWEMRNGEQVLWQAPRIAVVRAFLFSHVYHHRGQLSVYLRLLDVPVPAIYGPSADDNPWG